MIGPQAAQITPFPGRNAMVEEFMRIASGAPGLLEQAVPEGVIEEALRIRAVEQKFLELFTAGRMNGTVHTCVGQEFSGVAVAGQLQDGDWVTSNHRCHGHFISRTKNWRGLIDELMGLASGVCRGIGSSQHLYAPGFLSNGVQGSFVPVAAGIALHFAKQGLPGIVVSYIGEGTLGEGVLYEAMNLAALLRLRHLIVCENNLYSQSTPQQTGVAGDIAARARAFGLAVFEADTWNVTRLLEVARAAISYVREKTAPAFLVIRTYRLNAHSKGDDDRSKSEVEFFHRHDPLTRLMAEPQWTERSAAIQREIDEHVLRSDKSVLALPQYLRDQLPRGGVGHLRDVQNRRVRMVQALNEGYRKTLEKGAIHIGEDIHDPYGGAFKVTKGLDEAFPGALITTPISEAGIVGLATGAALMGTRAYAEIMFGDFMTNSFDQVVNNISKIHHMYAFQRSVPVRIRTPMGGKRGYGPTHSQSLEKFFVGLDNVAAIYLTSLIDPTDTLAETDRLDCPAILFENKVDYGKRLWEAPPHLKIQRENRAAGSLRITPRRGRPTVTIVSYGETARELADHLQDIFVETDIVPELIVLLMLHPLDVRLIARSARQTGRLIMVEDGSVNFGIGAEVVSRLVEASVPLRRVLRVGAEPVPIPSVSALEAQVLPTVKRVVSEILKAKFEDEA